MGFVLEELGLLSGALGQASRSIVYGEHLGHVS